MTHEVAHRPLVELAEIPSFSVVALHDGAHADQLTRHALDWLQNSLSTQITYGWSSWTFQNVERLDVRAMSLHAASAADMIIIAMSASSPLPKQIQHWLEATTQHTKEHKPLLVAMHPENMMHLPLHDYLEQAALRLQTLCISTSAFSQEEYGDFLEHFIINRWPQRRGFSPFDFSDLKEVSVQTAPQGQPGSSSSVPSMEVRDRAYFLWINAGRPFGQELAFWLQAEAEITPPA